MDNELKNAVKSEKKINLQTTLLKIRRKNRRKIQKGLTTISSADISIITTTSK